jgi:hypothetical protein
MKRILATAIAVIKALIALPCILWGSLIGIIGIGPEGFVPLTVRLTGLCFFFGGIGLGFPFSRLNTRRSVRWTLAVLSAVPACFMLSLANNDTAARKDPSFWLLTAILLLAVLLVFVELLLARNLRSTEAP